MPRPVKPRCVAFMPDVTYFKPAGVPMSELDEVCIGVDELEALRLKDIEGLEQEECAQRMGIAQSTFQRILTSARGKVAHALVVGKAIRIEGGHYRFTQPSEYTDGESASGENPEHGWSEGRGPCGPGCRRRHRRGRGNLQE